MIEHVGLDRASPGPRPARWAYALLAVMGGWVLFRSADLSGAIGYFASLFGRDGVSEISFDMHDALNDRAIMTLIIGCVLAVAPDGRRNGQRPSSSARLRTSRSLSRCSFFP